MDRRFLVFVATCSGPLAALAARLLGFRLSFNTATTEVTMKDELVEHRGRLAAVFLLLFGAAPAVGALCFSAGWAIVGITTVTVAAAALLTAFSMLIVRTVNQPGAPSWLSLWASQK